MAIHCIIKKCEIQAKKASSSPVTNVRFLLFIDITLIMSMNIYTKNIHSSIRDSCKNDLIQR